MTRGRGPPTLRLVACCVATACAGPSPDEHPPSSTVVSESPNPQAVRDTTTPGLLALVDAAPAEGWTGPGDRPFEVAVRSATPEAGHSRRFGTIALSTALRTEGADLTQYPCTSCHLGRRVTMANRRITDAHNNIQPVHPAQTGSVCSTCHSAVDVEQLTLRSGDHVSLNKSYRLCAQCHFGQAEAWACGGHGKRLDGWQGRRVVMACTDCHDPHRPAAVSRIPFQGPQLERKGAATDGH